MTAGCRGSPELCRWACRPLPPSQESRWPASLAGEGVFVCFWGRGGGGFQGISEPPVVVLEACAIYNTRSRKGSCSPRRGHQSLDGEAPRTQKRPRMCKGKANETWPVLHAHTELDTTSSRGAHTHTRSQAYIPPQRYHGLFFLHE